MFLQLKMRLMLQKAPHKQPKQRQQLKRPDQVTANGNDSIFHSNLFIESTTRIFC
jgi:hypothetical protein